ncbi:hypothetical protein PAMP_003413 [Pampus punctatissimus]
MDPSRLLVLVLMVIFTSEYSGISASACEEYDVDQFQLPEGEGFYFVPSEVHGHNLTDEQFTWYRNSSLIKYISSDEKERVHYHGAALIFLNLSKEDSGFYTGQYKTTSGECDNYHVKIDVFKGRHRMNKALYGSVTTSDMNQRIRCPDPVRETCKLLSGNFTWYKDFTISQNSHGPDLWIYNSTKNDEGIYTCICTWKHNHKVYNSSASRELTVLEVQSHRNPEILSPTTKEQFAIEGSEIKLNCSVYCGINVLQSCKASWHVNGKPFNKTYGYSQITTSVMTNHLKNTIATAVLTIERVSAEDFRTEFKCICRGFYDTVSATLTLKRRGTIIPLIIGGVCALFMCVLLAMMVKFFAIDLALFFRTYFPLNSHTADAKVFDAYVVYQMQSGDKVTEDTLCQFVTNVLPLVLEEKCGYRLFIHGRDDIPGEDRLELVEDRMKQSRRLMVILTPGSELDITNQRPTSPKIPVVGGFDWQVGLHHVLVQREMNVILIQLGDMGPQGYSHLPPGLQHLIRNSAPIRWPEGSRGAATWNSRFWKKVRYLMPAKPASKSPQGGII